MRLFMQGYLIVGPGSKNKKEVKNPEGPPGKMTFHPAREASGRKENGIRNIFVERRCKQV